jgi:nitrite reductase/ring-hydroxylating ferredoxin subunit
MMTGLKMQALCDGANVPAGAALRAELGGEVYAVFNVDGRFYVAQDHCTHGPGSLSEGFVEGEEIECPFHAGRFHIPTGQPVAPPCTVPLKIWTAEVIDGKICIDPLKPG